MSRAKLRNIGQHVMLSLCPWTAHSISHSRPCYKEEFYGIQSHRCIQMTPWSIGCNHNCVHCWRSPQQGRILETLLEPAQLMKQLIYEHRKLVIGFAGNPKSDKTKAMEAQQPNNVAMSLTGEAWMYPYLDELIGQFHHDGFSTVLVTAAGGADNLLNLENLPNFLYVSLISYDGLSYKQLSRPKVGNWSDLLRFCTGASYLETHRVLRITLIGGMNDHEEALSGFAKTFNHFRPHNVEIRSFTPVGRAFKLGRFRMLRLTEILEFSMKFCNITGTKLALQNNNSQVVLLRTNYDKKGLGPGRRALSDTCLGSGESSAQSSYT